VNKEGYRKIYFEVNGNQREITILDKQYQKTYDVEIGSTLMADPDNKKDIGASIPGTVAKVLVKAGDNVKAGQSLIIIEAMKMETQIAAPVGGKVANINVQEGQQVKNGELLMQLE